MTRVARSSGGGVTVKPVDRDFGYRQTISKMMQYGTSWGGRAPFAAGWHMNTYGTLPDLTLDLDDGVVVDDDGYDFRMRRMLDNSGYHLVNVCLQPGLSDLDWSDDYYNGHTSGFDTYEAYTVDDFGYRASIEGFYGLFKGDFHFDLEQAMTPAYRMGSDSLWNDVDHSLFGGHGGPNGRLIIGVRFTGGEPVPMLNASNPINQIGCGGGEGIPDFDGRRDREPIDEQDVYQVIDEVHGGCMNSGGVPVGSENAAYVGVGQFPPDGSEYGALNSSFFQPTEPIGFGTSGDVLLVEMVSPENRFFVGRLHSNMYQVSIRGGNLDPVGGGIGSNFYFLPDGHNFEPMGSLFVTSSNWYTGMHYLHHAQVLESRANFISVGGGFSIRLPSWIKAKDNPVFRVSIISMLELMGVDVGPYTPFNPSFGWDICARYFEGGCNIEYDAPDMLSPGKIVTGSPGSRSMRQWRISRSGH